ncbi:hypothetical protein BHC24_08410, partial [Oenococcus oeni]
LQIEEEPIFFKLFKCLIFCKFNIFRKCIKIACPKKSVRKNQRINVNKTLYFLFMINFTFIYA